MNRRMMMRGGAALALAAVLALSGCGGDSSSGGSLDSYCAEVKQAQGKFADMGELEPAHLADAHDTLQAIFEKAPDEVQATGRPWTAHSLRS